MRPCTVCGTPTDTAWTVDADIAGVPYCPRHKDVVLAALIGYVNGRPEMMQEITGTGKGEGKAQKGIAPKK